MRRLDVRLLLPLIALLVACGGQSCSCLAPIPGGFPTDGRRHENALQLRLSAAGVDYLDQNAAQLSQAIIPGGHQNTPVAVCPGQLCCGGAAGSCSLDVAISQPTLASAPPNALAVSARVAVMSMGDVQVSFTVIGFTTHCHLVLDTSLGTQHQDIGFNANLAFTVDPATDLTALALANPKLADLEPKMLKLSPVTIVDQGCNLGNIGFVQTLLSGQIAGQVAAQVEASFCSACATRADCDAWADACAGGHCMRAGKCVQEIGAAGRADLAAVSGLFAGTGARLDVLALLGGYAEAKQMPEGGLSLGLLGGAMAAAHSSCVPSRPAPALAAIPRWQEDAAFASVEPAGMRPYHLGLGIHQSWLETVAWGAFDAGALCAEIGTATVPQLDSLSFKALAPSLGDLTHEGDAPLRLALRPSQPPHVTLGAGTFDVNPMTMEKTVKDALLHMALPGFGIDVYAFIDGRFVRILTATADVSLGIGLDFDDQGNIVPLLGDLGLAFANVTVANSELLRETPEALAKLFPVVLAMAAGQLGQLPPIALPPLMGLSLSPIAIEPTDDLTTVSLFANFKPAGDALHAHTLARVVAVEAPPAAAFAVTTGLDPSQAPRVTLALDGRGLGGDASDLEWQWRLDGGAWSPFARARQPVVRDPRLWLPGRHQLAVRARVVGAPLTADPAPVQLEFVIAPGEGATVAAAGCSVALRRAGGGGGAAGFALACAWLIAIALRQRRRRSPPHPRRGAHATVAIRRAWPALVAGAVLVIGCNSSSDAPLTPGELLDPADEIGRYSDAVAHNGRIAISAYDDNFGDLAYAEIALGDVGKPIQWQWVDGVPADAAVAMEGGFRRGVLDPGDDVGRDSSLALGAGGDPRIAYFDVTHGALKFAAGSHRHFHVSVVEQPAGAGAFAGRYASLSLDAAGVPSIAYLASNLPSGAGFRSVLRLATARNADPAGPDDWILTDVDAGEIPCNGRCPMGTACVAPDPMAPVRSGCLPLSSDCAPECRAPEECVTVGATPLCQTPLPKIAAPGLPDGVGLFAQLRRLPSGARVIAYYDHQHGDARLASETAPGSTVFTLSFVQAHDPAADLGQFTSAAVAADGTLHVAFGDATGDRLLYKSIKGGAVAQSPEVIDDGERPGEAPHPVGGGAALWVDGAGLRVIYQDQLAGDLLEATRGGGGWQSTAIATGPAAFGFYNHVVGDGGQLFFTSFVYDRAAAAAARPLGTLLVHALP